MLTLLPMRGMDLNKDYYVIVKVRPNDCVSQVT